MMQDQHLPLINQKVAEKGAGIFKKNQLNLYLKEEESNKGQKCFNKYRRTLH